MTRSFGDSFLGFGSDMLESIRKNSNMRLDDAAFEERVFCIKKATAALCEAWQFTTPP